MGKFNVNNLKHVRVALNRLLATGPTDYPFGRDEDILDGVSIEMAIEWLEERKRKLEDRHG